ncbi:MAG: hypothetical protein H6710_09660 [Myxococcales bacterium]|nr:hypothetical protein [Myxococcales bacterium]
MDQGALLPGPALVPWLRHRLRESRAPALWIAPRAGRGVVGRGLARALRGLDLPQLAASPCDLVVVVTTLDDPAPPAAVAALIAGGRLVELAHPPPWGWRELFALGARRARLRWAIERRARACLGAGIFALSQWSPVEPLGVLVSEGRRRIGAPPPGSWEGSWG